jgi:hypothetical protein
MKKEVFIFCTIFLLSCTTIPLEKQCSVDSDCVKATCCHAVDSVNKEHGPDCTGNICTLDCEPGTLDCGGKVKCIENTCAAVIA